MIKKIIVLCSVVSALFLPSVALAQSNIGVISLEAVLAASNYSRQQFQKLQANPEYKKLLEKIKSLKEELQTLQKEGETKSLTWSNDQKRSHIEKGQKKLAEYKQLGAQELNARNSLEARLEKELGPRVEEIVNVVIQEKKIGLLLKSQAVFYRTAEFDITEEVIKRLNATQP